MPNPFTSIGSVPLTKLALNAQERADMIAFLQNLVQMPSHSGEEKAAAGLIKEKLKEVGVADVSVDRVGNVIAQLGPDTGLTLLMDAHMDTVSPARGSWPHEPYAGVIEDGYLYGLGSCDMKASIAAMVYALKRLVKSGAPLNGRLVCAFVVQEEPCEGGALEALMEETGIRPDYVLLGEPSDMKVMLGHRGRVMFKVTVRGRSSHASTPELGFNAITAAARLIFGIEMLAADMASDPFMGPGTIAVTHIESEAASLNAVPHACSFHVDRRLTLGETPSRAQSQLEAVLQREGIDASIEITRYTRPSYTGYAFDVLESFDAWAIDPGHKLVQQIKSAVKAVRGQEVTTGHWPFSTDGVYSMGKANIPTVGFGPGDPHTAHTVNERVRLEDVVQAAQVYGAFAALTLSTG
ncbi:MAG: YgeY family selenium metabolism-linked hydrolase [Chloroflexi bacterium]|nr:YgeY family selenium metabolism-linked hydrolase [Chloroflexota bacterium]